MFFGVHQKPLTHFTILSGFVLPFGVHRPILGTEVLYTNIGQYYSEGLILQVSMVCWVIPSAEIAVLNVNCNSKNELYPPNPQIFIFPSENPFVGFITAVSTCFN